MADETTAKTEKSGEHASGFEIAIAILLGIAATLTAWSAFQSGLLGGDSQKEFTKATLSSDQAGQWWNQGNQRQIHDEGLWLEYAKAAREENTDLAQYYYDSLMDENMQKAIDWYGEQPEEVDSPFVELEEATGDDVNPYTIDEYAEAEAYDKKSAKSRKLGEKYDSWGDKFDGVSVLLATALFMFGISAVFKSRFVRTGTLLFGTVLLVVSAVRLYDLGVYQWTA